MTGAGLLRGQRTPAGFVLGASGVLALAFATAVSPLAFDLPVWRLSGEGLFQLGGAVAAYTAVLLGLFLLQRPAHIRLAWVVPLTVFAFGGMTLFLTLAGRPPTSHVLVPSLVATPLLASVPWISNRARLVVVAAFVALAGAGFAREAGWSPAGKTTTTKRVVVSALADLNVITYRGAVPVPQQDGGAIAPLGDGFLLVDGDGRLSQLDWDANDDTLRATPLALHVPVNFELYRRDAPSGAFQGAYRVADLIAQDLGERVRLLASHHYWIQEGNCWVARVSETVVRKDGLGADDPGDWRTLFQSQPCLPLNKVTRAGPFLQMGGAMALVDSRHVLLALGDHAYDGINATPAVSQDPTVDYGKTLVIDLETGKHDVFTMGHRNNHGAVVDAAGHAWVTEMGPQGGDELNRLERGANYGWPIVTFGTQYGGSLWPNSPTPDQEAGFHGPAYAWVPSVAPSGLIQAGSRTVALWQGDFLAGSLRGQSLFRIRVADGHVVYVEPIPMGLRIRDLAESPKGRIVLWNDSGVIVSIRVAAGAQGARLFGLCASCHQRGNGTNHGVGPNLAGVVGRSVASASGYDYSPALRQAGGIWTQQRLAEFLADPQKFAPGTSMPAVAISDPEDRSALIAFLKKR